MLPQRELLSNTIRHAQATEVSISVKAHQNKLTIFFSDNGIGFDQLAITPGNGLFNVQARTNELMATIDWNSSSGTQVIVRIPIINSGHPHE